MIVKQKNNIKFLQFKNFLNQQGIIHFSTTRIGGKSAGKLKSLNLGYTVNDIPEIVNSNLDKLAAVLGFEKKQMVSPKQTHSKNIGVVKSTNDIFDNTDALITNVPNICIFIRTADCVPILLYDTKHNACAAIHSGWKSTIQEISRYTIERMQKEFGTNPQDIIAGIGPSIGPEVYEVGPEVILQFDRVFGKNHNYVPIENSNKSLLNLWEINKHILIDSGIPECQIEVAEMCTFSNPELFYSARRNGVKTGRLASGIMIPNK